MKGWIKVIGLTMVISQLYGMSDNPLLELGQSAQKKVQRVENNLDFTVDKLEAPDRATLKRGLVILVCLVPFYYKFIPLLVRAMEAKKDEG